MWRLSVFWNVTRRMWVSDLREQPFSRTKKSKKNYSWTAGCLKVGEIGCTATLVNSYKPTLNNVPQQREIKRFYSLASMQTSCKEYFHPAFNLEYIGDCFPGGKAAGAWRTIHLFTFPSLKCMDLVPYDLMTCIMILLLTYYLIFNVTFVMKMCTCVSGT